MRRNSPCLATKKLDNYTLVPFQVVPPVLPCCLHLKIISMSSFYHIVCTSTTIITSSLTSTSGPAFYLHFVLPVLLRLLAWPLHPDCVLKITAAISSLKFSPKSYLFVSPCSHSSNFETNSWESCWSRPANSILNFPTVDLKSEGAIDLYWEDQSAFKTCREC